jgi:hypothetical protein
VQHRRKLGLNKQKSLADSELIVRKNSVMPAKAGIQKQNTKIKVLMTLPDASFRWHDSRVF